MKEEYYYGQGRRAVGGNLVWCYIYVCISRQEDIEFRGRTGWELALFLVWIMRKRVPREFHTSFGNHVELRVLFQFCLVFFCTQAGKRVSVSPNHNNRIRINDSNWREMYYSFVCYVLLEVAGWSTQQFALKSDYFSSYFFFFVLFYIFIFILHVYEHVSVWFLPASSHHHRSWLSSHPVCCLFVQHVFWHRAKCPL